MPKLRILCLALASMFYAYGAFAAPALNNGVSLHGPLTWGQTNADKTGYTGAPYAGAHYEVPAGLLHDVKAAGFDFIRLSVDPGPFLALKGAEHDALEHYLLSVITAIRQTGLDVLVDFHPIGMVSAYAPAQIEDIKFHPMNILSSNTSVQIEADEDLFLSMSNWYATPRSFWPKTATILPSSQ